MWVHRLVHITWVLTSVVHLLVCDSWASLWLYELAPGAWVVMIHGLMNGSVLLGSWC